MHNADSGEELEFQYQDQWYIKTRGQNDRRAAEKCGGFSQGFSAAEKVYGYDDVAMLYDAGHANWGVAGVRDQPQKSVSLLIFDLDTYKATDDDSPARVTVDDCVPIVQTQSGGFHLWFLLHSDRGSVSEANIEIVPDITWDVDIRDSAVNAIVAAPGGLPGIGSPYRIVQERPLPGIFSPREACELVVLDGEPLLSYNASTHVRGDWSLDDDVEPPKEMQRCYQARLRLRRANPDDHPNTLTAMCGLAAGYSIEEMVRYFCEESAPGLNVSEQRTEHQLTHLADKIERVIYSGLHRRRYANGLFLKNTPRASAASSITAPTGVIVISKPEGRMLARSSSRKASAWAGKPLPTNSMNPCTGCT